MLKTMDLQYIYENLMEDVFDFDYDWTDIVIGTTTYSKTYLQDAFKEYWWYYQIGYSTLDEFKWRLKRNWKATINEFAQRLSLYPQELSLNESITEKQYTHETDNKFSDTPNQPMLDTDTDGQYLTDRTKVDANGNINEIKTRNELQKYAEINKAITDVMYEFIKTFKPLFITDIIIYDGILKGGLD